MLDVHPHQDGFGEVLIRDDGDEVHAGEVTWTPEFVTAIRKTQGALLQVVEEDLYQFVDRKDFLFREYHDTDMSWQQTLSALFVGPLVADDRLMARGTESMNVGRAEIVLAERASATVLRRV